MTITDILAQCTAGNLVFTGICDPNRVDAVTDALQPDSVSAIGTLIQTKPSVPYRFEFGGEDKAKDEHEDSSIDVLFVGNYSLFKSGQDLLEAWLPKIKPGGYIICFDHYAEADATFTQVDDTTTDYPPNWYRQA